MRLKISAAVDIPKRRLAHKVGEVCGTYCPIDGEISVAEHAKYGLLDLWYLTFLSSS